MNLEGACSFGEFVKVHRKLNPGESAEKQNYILIATTFFIKVASCFFNIHRKNVCKHVGQKHSF